MVWVVETNAARHACVGQGRVCAVKFLPAAAGSRFRLDIAKIALAQ